MDNRLKEISASLREMKSCLHAWDDVDNQIDAVLEEIDAAPQAPQNQIEEFRKKRDQLRQLTFKAIQENVDNLETGETALKATAVGGLAIPTAVTAGVYAVPILAGFGIGKLASLALLAGAGAVANGFVGGAANALGQGVAAPYHYFATGRVPNVVGDWWEMSAAHAMAGAVAGGAVVFKTAPWVRSVPIALAGLTSYATILSANHHSVSHFMDPEDFEKRPYDGSLVSYLSLAHQLNENLISEKDFSVLRDHALQSGNPAIQMAYAQILTGDGELVVASNEGEKSFCLNFSDHPKELPCNIGSQIPFRKSGIFNKSVSPNFEISFANTSLQKQYAIDDLPALEINQNTIPADKGLAMIMQNPEQVTLVNHLLPRIYGGLLLPEGANVVTHSLLNFFMTTDQIGPDVKNHYAEQLQNAVHHYGAIFKNNLADMRLHPHDYKERIRSEHLLLQNLFGRYQQWAKSNWIPDALHWAEPIWKKYAETIDAAYTDWESIQFKILQKGSGRYERAAEEAYVSMLDKYLKGSRGIYDIWREESGLEGAVSGWLLNGLLKKSTTLQSKGLWAAAGYLTYLNGKALLDAGMFPPPIDLYLPQINGYAGLHTILMSDEGAKFEK